MLLGAVGQTCIGDGQTDLVCRVFSIGMATHSNAVVYSWRQLDDHDLSVLRDIEVAAQGWVYSHISDIKRALQDKTGQTDTNRISIVPSVPAEFTIRGIRFSQYCRRLSFLGQKQGSDRVVIEYFDPKRYENWMEFQPYRNGGFPWYFRIVMDATLREVISAQVDPM